MGEDGMRTYKADDWHRAQAEWLTFGAEWAELRQIAAARGLIFPPNGSAHDDRDAENPTQRAIIWRALVDNPTELKRVMRTASSWSQVVDRIIGMESRLRLEAGDLERDAAWDRDHLPTHREAAMSIADIFKRIEESL